MASAITRLPLAQISRGGRAWPREQLDEDRVALFREMLAEDPTSLPPTIVVADGNGGFILADGHHRATAHEQLGGGYDLISAEVRQAPPGHAPTDYAYAIALDCSAKTSVPLTRAEKQAAIRRLAAERPDLSDRAIGRLAGVSHATVGHIRRPAGQVDHRPTSSRPSRRSIEQTVELVIRAGQRLGSAHDVADAARLLAAQLLGDAEGDRDNARRWAAWHEALWTTVERQLAGS